MIPKNKQTTNHEWIMGIDVGTSSCKTAVFDVNGSVQAASEASYSLMFPKPSHVEQHPDIWWQKTVETIIGTIKQLGSASKRIKCVGISGQSWAAVALDDAGRVLCPTPIWMDTRETEYANNIADRIGRDQLFSMTGNRFTPGYVIPKILTMQKEKPNIYKNTRVFLQSNGFIGYRLTGEIAMDKSQGNGLHIFDIATGAYNHDRIHQMGLDAHRFPPIVDGHEIIGTVSAQASAQTGLPKGTKVVAGGLDASCAALGCGVYKPGQTHFQAGSSAVLSVCTDRLCMHPDLIVSMHSAPGTWILQGGTSAFCGSYKWLADVAASFEKACCEQTGENVYARMDKMAETINQGADGLFYLPYLSGERSPIWDSKAKGLFIGLDYSKTPAHMMRACLEGCAYSILHNAQTMKKADARIERLIAGGGGSKSRLWMQMVCDMLDKPIDIASSDTASCLGAAMLAAVGTGIYRDFAQAADLATDVSHTLLPDRTRNSLYQKRFPIYRSLYTQNRSIMHSIAEVESELDLP